MGGLELLAGGLSKSTRRFAVPLEGRYSKSHDGWERWREGRSSKGGASDGDKSPPHRSGVPLDLLACKLEDELESLLVLRRFAVGDEGARWLELLDDFRFPLNRDIGCDRRDAIVGLDDPEFPAVLSSSEPSAYPVKGKPWKLSETSTSPASSGCRRPGTLLRSEPTRTEPFAAAPGSAPALRGGACMRIDMGLIEPPRRISK